MLMLMATLVAALMSGAWYADALMARREAQQAEEDVMEQAKRYCGDCDEHGADPSCWCRKGRGK